MIAMSKCEQRKSNCHWLLRMVTQCIFNNTSTSAARPTFDTTLLMQFNRLYLVAQWDYFRLRPHEPLLSTVWTATFDYGTRATTFDYNYRTTTTETTFDGNRRCTHTTTLVQYELYDVQLRVRLLLTTTFANYDYFWLRCSLSITTTTTAGNFSYRHWIVCYTIVHSTNNMSKISYITRRLPLFRFIMQRI